MSLKFPQAKQNVEVLLDALFLAAQGKSRSRGAEISGVSSIHFEDGPDKQRLIRVKNRTLSELAGLRSSNGEPLSKRLLGQGKEDAIRNVLRILINGGLVTDHRPQKKGGNTKNGQSGSWHFCLTLAPDGELKSTVKRALSVIEVEHNNYLAKGGLAEDRTSRQPFVGLNASDEDACVELPWKQLCKQALDRASADGWLVPPPTANRLRNAQHLVHQVRVSQPATTDARSLHESAPAGPRVLEYQLSSPEFIERLLRGDYGTRVVLLGDAGAGKSTLLTDVARRLLSTDDDACPVFVPLRELDLDLPRPLETYLRLAWLPLLGGRVAEGADAELNQRLEELLRRGRVWLLLDGVDELQTDPAKQVGKFIAVTREWQEYVRVLATCRRSAWNVGAGVQGAGDFIQVMLHPFDEASQQQMFERTLGPERAKRLRAALERQEHGALQELVQNPLMLTLLCDSLAEHDEDVPHDESSLPLSRAELFEEFFNLQWEREARKSKADLGTRGKVKGALAQLAWEAYFVKEPKQRIGRDHFEAVFSGGNGEALIRRVLALGWLRPGARGGAYGFAHATFQEYFASLRVEAWHQDLFNPSAPEPVYLALTPKGRAVSRVWAGNRDVPQTERLALVDALLRFSEDDTSYLGFLALCHGASLLAEIEPPAKREVVICLSDEEVVRKLLKWALDTNRKQEALQALRHLNSLQLAPIFEEMIGEEIENLKHWLAKVKEELDESGGSALNELSGFAEQAVYVLQVTEESLSEKLDWWAELSLPSLFDCSFLRSLPGEVETIDEDIRRAIGGRISLVAASDPHAAGLASEGLRAIQRATSVLMAHLELAGARMSRRGLSTEGANRLVAWLPATLASGDRRQISRVLGGLFALGPSLPTSLLMCLLEFLEVEVRTNRWKNASSPFSSIVAMLVKMDAELVPIAPHLEALIREVSGDEDIALRLYLAQLLARANPSHPLVSEVFNGALSDHREPSIHCFVALAWLAGVPRCHEAVDVLLAAISPPVDVQLLGAFVSRLEPAMVSHEQAGLLAGMILPELIRYHRQIATDISAELGSAQRYFDLGEKYYSKRSHCEFWINRTLPIARHAEHCKNFPHKEIRALFEYRLEQNKLSERFSDELGPQLRRIPEGKPHAQFMYPWIVLDAGAILARVSGGTSMVRSSLLKFLELSISDEYESYGAEYCTARVADWAQRSLSGDMQAANLFRKVVEKDGERSPVAVQRIVYENLGPTALATAMRDGNKARRRT